MPVAPGVFHRFRQLPILVLIAAHVLARITGMDKAIAEELFRRLWPHDQVVATTDQLLAAGLTTRLLEVGVCQGLLHRLRRGVYIPSQQWQGRPPWIQDKMALFGHVALSNGLPVYSHFSAARLHRLQVWNSSPLIHVSAGYNASAAKLPDDVVLHKLEVPDEDVVQGYVKGVGAVRFTSLRRTVLDCAMVAPFAQAVVIGDSALNKGLLLEEVVSLLAVAVGRRGVRRARRAIEAMNALSESAGETRTRLFVAELPIEQPEIQVWLDSSRGSFRVDFVWRRLRLILEFDGDTKYFDFSKPADQVLIEERERENALIEEGWRFIRVKWRHLNEPEMLKARIMRAYLGASSAAA